MKAMIKPYLMVLKKIVNNLTRSYLQDTLAIQNTCVHVNICSVQLHTVQGFEDWI